jgi:histidinol-phosphate aminotransferase
MTESKESSPILSRPELQRFEPYKPGLSVREIARQYGLKTVIKLASNENPLGPSPKARSAYKKISKDIYRYPETKSVELRRTIAEKYKMDIDQVIIGAGSDEIIELLAKAFLNKGDEIIVSAHSFIQYQIAARLMGANISVVRMNDMKHDLMGMAASVTGKTKLLFIANPNNPTGTYNTQQEVEKFLAALPPRVIPVFDEAYFEYASVNSDYPSMIEDYFRKRPMVVLRTFSKIYGLAGLRVGYGVGPESIIAELDKIRPPFNVSKPAQAAGMAALSDDKHVKKSISINEKEKKNLRDALTQMGFDVIPSATNFLLFRVEPRTGRALFDALLHKGIITRSVDEYGLPGYLRVTVGESGENKKFLQALREVIGKS